MRWITLFLLCTPAFAAEPTSAPRIKDLASIEGVRDNQLVGYGIVVGLAGTGDRRQTIFSAQSLSNMLERTAGVIVPPSAMRVTNTAAVMVTATLPPFARPGSKLDVTASAIGDAGSLQGGVLLITSLKGVDGQTYAVAQGPLAIGGYAASAAGTSKSLNHPNVGRAANAALVERPAPAVKIQDAVVWQLNSPDFTTAARIAKAVNAAFPDDTNPLAKAENSGTVVVRIPPSLREQSTQFIAQMEGIRVEADVVARVVVNERTGTVAFGKDVVLLPASIVHGALSVEIQTDFIVSQPEAFSQGKTQTVPKVDLQVTEEKGKSIVLPKNVTVEQLVKALGGIGATPRDIISILQNLRAIGALTAELVTI